MSDNPLVYSTEGGRIASTTPKTEAISTSPDGVVRIHRETKGRKGKGVSLIKGLGLDAPQVQALCTELKKQCGCGGTVKEGVIEIQTDNREKLQALLIKKGFSVKLAGG